MKSKLQMYEPMKHLLYFLQNLTKCGYKMNSKALENNKLTFPPL